MNIPRIYDVIELDEVEDDEDEAVAIATNNIIPVREIGLDEERSNK